MSSPIAKEMAPNDSRWKFLKLLNSTLGFGVIIYFVGSLALYYYLNEIGWTELMQESISSGPGLALIFSGLSIVIGAMSFLFFGPSILLYLGISSYFKEVNNLPRYAPYSIAINQVIWSLIFSSWLWGGQIEGEEEKHLCLHWIAKTVVEYFGLILSIFIVFSCLAAILLHWKEVRKLQRNYKQHVALGLFVALASIMSVTTTFSILSVFPSETWGAYKYLAIPIIATAPGIIIGFTLTYNARKSGITDATKRALLLAALIFFLIFGPLGSYTLPRVVLGTLSIFSVYSNEPVTFQLLDTKQKLVFEKLQFPVIVDLISEIPSTNNRIVYFNAYVQYRFAGILLLCSTSYDFLSEEDNKKTNQQCIQTNAGEVRRIQLFPLSR